MRYLKVAVTFVASVVLSGLLGLAGCDDDHGRHFRGDDDRHAERYDRDGGDRHDGDRHEERREGERHEERGER